MNRVLRKLIVILFLVLMLINNSLLTIISVAISDAEKMMDVSKVNAIFEMNVDKYVNYSFKSNVGVMLQVNLSTGIKYEEGKEHKAVSKTEMDLNMPKINDKYPEKVEVIGNSTQATNGSEVAKDFNYSYDNQSGNLIILALNNPDKEGNIYRENTENKRDNYTVISYYASDCYTDKNLERKFSFTGKISVTLEDEEKIESEIEQTYNVDKNISGLISTQIDTSDIYNGFINANINNQTSYNTEYTEKIQLEVGYENIADEIEIETNSKFLSKNNKRIETNKIVYNGIRINKNQILDKLGENFKIEIFDLNKQLVAEINNETEVQEDGFIEIDYENELTDIIIKVKSPIKLGKMEFENKKVIKSEIQNLENTKIIALNKIHCVNVEEEKDEETQEIINKSIEEVYNFENEKEIEIKQSTTRIDVDVDKLEWVNNTQNDVVFRAILNTNGQEYNLFTNPVLEIKLPKEVEKVILEDVSLLYDSDLSVEESTVIEDTENKIIRIKLNGMQKAYTTSTMYKGAEILIPATIILAKDINSISTKLDISYTNESGTVNDYVLNNKTCKNLDIKIMSLNNTKEERAEVEIAKDIDVSNIKTEITASVGNKVLENDDIVYEGQIIKYGINITNNSDKAISGLKVLGNIPNGTAYATVKKGFEENNVILDEEEDNTYDFMYEYVEDYSVQEFEKVIDIINPGETANVFYEVKVNKIDEDEDEVISDNEIVVQSSLGQQISKFIITNKIEKAELQIELKSANSRSDADHNDWFYYIEINNISERNIENLDIEFYVPKYLNVYKTFLQTGECEFKASDINENNIINMNLEKIDKDETLIIEIKTRGYNFESDIYEYPIVATAKISGESIPEYWTCENRQTMVVEGVEVIQQSDKEGKKLKYEEEVEYKVNIKNVGNSLKNKYTYVNVLDYLPNELNPISAEYENYIYNQETGEYIKTLETVDLNIKIIAEGTEEEENANMSLYLSIPMEQEVNIIIKAKANLVYEETEISNAIIVKGDRIVAKTSNIIKNIILPYNVEEDTENPEPDNPGIDNPGEDKPNPDNPNNPDNSEDTEKVNNISGLTWLDSNKNGKREDTETLISNIKVKLFNADTNQIVTDKDGNKKIVLTDNEGKYNFTDIEKGNYLILFEFDTNEYKITDYQVLSASEKNNSDAILKEVSIDGKEMQVGLTDILKLDGTDLENIDIGLIKKQNLDFSLKKYVSKITVTNEKETKEYKYDKSQLAKVEVHAKQFANTTVLIEYKIVVTNEGEVPGVINEIIDYIPNELTFDSNTNRNWTKNVNGYITTSSLAGITINPGESKEVTVTAYKKLNDESAGTIINAAEIGNIYNTENLIDIDSEVANKNKLEDDYSEAEVIISVKTGIVTYTIVIISMLLVLGLIFFLIKNNKLKLKGILSGVVVGILMSTLIVPNISNAGELEDWACNTNYPFGTNFGEVFIQYNAGNFATNSLLINQYANLDKFHCTDGSKSMCGKGEHYYLFQVPAVYVTLGTPVYENQNNYNNSTQNAEIRKLNNSYNIAGPYNISKSGAAVESVDGITVYGKSGIVEASVVDINGNSINLPFGTDFYIKIPSSQKEIEKIDLQITSNITIAYNNTSYQIIEYWRCNRVAGRHSREGCKTPEGTQPLERVWTKWGLTYREYTAFGTTISLPGAKMKRGNLRIQKIDADSGQQIAGATFNIKGTGEVNYYNNNVTMTSGQITIPELEIGNYVVTEIGAPNEYNINFQTDRTKNTTITMDNTTSLTFANRKYGSLVIQKTDSDTGGAIRTAGFTFKIFVVSGNVPYYISSYTNGSPSSVTYTTNANDAKTFSTDANGQIQLYNIPINLTYYIQETGVPSSLQGYYEVKNSLDAVNLVNNSTTIKNVANKQIYTDLSGYVWEDKNLNNKATTYNHLYKEGSEDTNDRRVSGITVRLKHNNGTIIDTQITDSQGAYKFKKVRISELSNYYIEFEYNGLKYTNVTKTLSKENGSKATEKIADRTNFNNTYASITGGNSKGTSTTGYSRDTSGNITNSLKYINGTYSSSLVQNMGQTVSSASSYVNAQNNSVGVRMTSNTSTAGYSLKWAVGSKEITSVNFGIIEREQPDMAIASDIDTIDLQINGYKHTYSYGERYKLRNIDIFSELEKYKNNNASYPRTYTRSIYKNYMFATSDKGEGKLGEQDKLKVYFTYKTTIKNESSSLYMSANEIAYYLEKTMGTLPVDSWYIDSNGNSKKIEWQHIQNGGNGNYNEIRTKSLSNVKIPNGQSLIVYVKVQKKAEEILKWASQEELNDKTRNIVEVTSYSVFDKNGNRYAGIDKDSAPDNIEIGNVKTYEDDTDTAPEVVITFDKMKAISGYVFEDNTDSKTKTNKERKGDGKYNASEDGYVENVKVELINVKDDKATYIYPKFDKNSSKSSKKAEYITTKDKKGYYEFAGVIPGKYYLKFTYGDGSIIYKPTSETGDISLQDYKSTIVTTNVVKDAITGGNQKWYQDSSVKGYSMAVDDYGIRTELNKKLSTVNYEVKTNYEARKGEYQQYKYMIAKSPIMDIAIENTDGQITNMSDENKRVALYDNLNFGIVERPRQQVEVYKNVSYIKLQLANGQTLVEGDPRKDKIRYVTYPEGGLLKIEVDSELIEGATLYIDFEIKIKNSSELDYNTQNYYNFGIIKGGDTPVATSISTLADYMSDELKTQYSYNSEDGIWHVVEPGSDNRLENIKIEQSAYNAIKNKRNILLINNPKVKANSKLLPGEEGIVNISASKLLSNTDEMLYENKTEILALYNEVGRFYGQNDDSVSIRKWNHITQGNYNINENPLELDENNKGSDSRKAMITIVPPTGVNRDYYIIPIIIISLIILSVGIVIIKKKVLK